MQSHSVISVFSDTGELQARVPAPGRGQNGQQDGRCEDDKDLRIHGGRGLADTAQGRHHAVRAGSDDLSRSASSRSVTRSVEEGIDRCS